MRRGNFPDGKCYLWWFVECGATVSQIGEVSRSLGFYPRVCDVAALLRRFMRDANQKLSGVTFNGSVFHVSSDVARMSPAAFCRFSADNRKFVGGDRVIMPSGASPELAYALLAKSGVSNEEFETEVMNRAVRCQGSSLSDIVVQGKICEMQNSLSSNVKKKNNIRVNVHLDAKGLAELKLRYPEFEFSMGKNPRNHLHAVSFVARQCDQRILLDRVGYMCGGAREVGFDVLVKDIGANWLTNFKMGRLDMHNCCPILDVRDASRCKDRLHELSRYVNSPAWSSVPNVSGITDTRQSVFSDPVLLRRFLCFRRAEDCRVTAPVSILLHSAYDMTTEQIADALDSAKSRVAAMCMYFDPLMLFYSSGEMKMHGVVWEKNHNKSGRIDITFAFKGDSSYCYTHDLETYLKKFTTPVYTSSLGIHYTVEWIDYRDGTAYARLVSLEGMPFPRSSLKTKFFLDMDDKFMVLLCPNIDWETFSCIDTKLKPVRIVVPVDVFNKVYSYAMVSNGTRFTPADVRAYALSVNSRVLINGVSVMAKTRLSGRELDFFSTAVYIMAYRDRWYRDRLIDDFRTDEDKFRSQEYTGILGLMWERMKTWIPFMGKSTASVDLTLDDLTDMELPESWITTSVKREPKKSNFGVKAYLRGVLVFERKYPTEMAHFLPASKTFSQEVEGMVADMFDGEGMVQRSAATKYAEPLVSDEVATMLESAVASVVSKVGPVFADMVAGMKTESKSCSPDSGVCTDTNPSPPSPSVAQTSNPPPGETSIVTTTGLSADTFVDSGIVERVVDSSMNSDTLVKVPGVEVPSRQCGLLRECCAVGNDEPRISMSPANNLCAFRAMMCCVYDDRAKAEASYNEVMAFKKRLRESQYVDYANHEVHAELQPNAKTVGSAHSMFVAAHEFKVNFCVHTHIGGMADGFLLIECKVPGSRIYHLYNVGFHYYVFDKITRIQGDYIPTLDDFFEDYDLTQIQRSPGETGSEFRSTVGQLRCMRARMDSVDPAYLQRVRPLIYEIDVQKEEFVSRSAFKLLEILDHYHIDVAASEVLDLGAAPGGFSQVLLRRGARVSAVTLHDGVKMNETVAAQCMMIQDFRGDITDERLQKRLVDSKRKYDVVVSDAAVVPDGKEEEQEMINSPILRAVVDIVQGALRKGGTAIVKVLDSFEVGTVTLMAELMSMFRERWIVRPIATRAASSEKFMVLRGFKESSTRVRVEDLHTVLTRITLRQLEYVGRLVEKINGNIADFGIPRLQVEYLQRIRKLAGGGTRWCLREGNIRVEMEHARVGREPVIFSHCISADLGSAGHMTKGVATVFASVMGRPERKHLTPDGALTVQRSGSLIVVGVITKEKYNMKPTNESYAQGMNALARFVASEGVSRLVCPPMGTMRDGRPFSAFARAVSCLRVPNLEVVMRRDDFRGDFETRKNRLNEALIDAFMCYTVVEHADGYDEPELDELEFKGMTFFGSVASESVINDRSGAKALVQVDADQMNIEENSELMVILPPPPEYYTIACVSPEPTNQRRSVFDTRYAADLDFDFSQLGDDTLLTVCVMGPDSTIGAASFGGGEMPEYFEDDYFEERPDGGEAECVAGQVLDWIMDNVERTVTKRESVELSLVSACEPLQSAVPTVTFASETLPIDVEEEKSTKDEEERDSSEDYTQTVARSEPGIPQVRFVPKRCCAVVDVDCDEFEYPGLLACAECYRVVGPHVNRVLGSMNLCRAVSFELNSLIVAVECVAADSVCAAGHVRPLPDYYWLVTNLVLTTGPVRTLELLRRYWVIAELRTMCSTLDLEVEMLRWTPTKDTRKFLKAIKGEKKEKLMNNILRLYVSCFTAGARNVHHQKHISEACEQILSSDLDSESFRRTMGTFFLDRIKKMSDTTPRRILRKVDMDECILTLPLSNKREVKSVKGSGPVKKYTSIKQIFSTNGKKTTYKSTAIGVFGLEFDVMQTRIEEKLDERDRAVHEITAQLDKDKEVLRSVAVKQRLKEEMVREVRQTKAETPPPVRSCDRRLVLLDEDRRNLSRIRPTGFNPRLTALVSVYKDSFTVESPKLQLRFQRLEMAPVELSYGRFRSSYLQDGSVVLDVYIDEKHTGMGRDWASQLHRFLRDMMSTVVQPILMVMRFTNLVTVLAGDNELVCADLVRVFSDFNSVMHPHRFAVITTGDDYKMVSRAFERFKPLDYVNPVTGMEFWQRTIGSLSPCSTYTPKLQKVETTGDYARNSMSELRELWRVKPQLIMSELSDVYHTNRLSTANINSSARQTVSLTKGNYGVISVASGSFIIKPTVQKQDYQYAYDGSKLVALRKENDRYVLKGDVLPAGETLLVSDETELINEYSLYEKVYPVNLDEYVLPHIKLIQGVPGCGKTTYILNKVEEGDLVLFSTREGAADFRSRVSKKRPDRGEQYLRKHYRTVHSYIINRDVREKFRRVYVDEALMMHCGEVLFAAHLAGAEEVILLGDVNQIPYINRTPQCSVAHSAIDKLCASTEYLSVSYRCTVTVACILAQYYNEGMKSTSMVRGELSLELFLNVDSLNLEQRDQVLVFTQNEKTEILKVHKTVSTVHEFQGRQAESIVVVRATGQKYEVFEHLPHCLVAISRHTEKFRYITTDTSDMLSRWVDESKYLTVADLDEHHVSLKDMTAAGGELPQRDYAVALPYLPSMNYHTNILDTYYQWGFSHVTTAKLFDVNRFEVVIPQPRYVMQNYCDNITVLQCAYDELFPLNSIHYLEFDVYQVNVVEDLELQVADMMIDASRLRNYSTPWFERLKPSLRTCMPQNRPNTSIESLLAIIKRNLNVPGVQGCVFSKDLAKNMLSSFVESYIPPERRDLFEAMKNMPIEPNAVNIAEWLEGQPSQVVGNIGLTQPLHNMSLNLYQFMIKSTVKPQLDTRAPYIYSSLQTIAYHTKDINAIFCPVFREIKDRLTKVLGERFLIFCDQSPEEFADLISSRFDVEMFYRPHMEVDMSKFDKSQGSAALDFEIMIMKKFGVPDYLTELWYEAHHNSILVDRDNGLQVKLVYQRKSGDASTFLGNTMFLMAVLSMLFDMSACDFAAFSGDDSLLIGDGVMYDRNFLCANLFNLESKFFRNFQYKYFCSKFLLPVGDRVYFVPDLAKLLTKLGRSDLVNWEHVEEYRVSLCDLTKIYSNAAINEVFEAALRERYKCGPLQLGQVLSAIRFFVSYRAMFRTLYWMVPGSKLCHDPSRPKLD
ncbi:replicase [Erysiphe necator associated virga-like virus 1]|nr:replicase [Erysiphe necator associated virga-like virus 1]